MTDDYDVTYLNEGEVNEVVAWAVNTGAILVSMQLNLDEVKEQFADDPWEAVEAYIATMALMHETLPVVVIGPAHAIAANAIEEVAQEESEVESFREEIERFEQNGHSGLSD